jgi:SAM-dependent methyltransferase
MDSGRRRIDPEEYGYSLANLLDVMLPCLEAMGARSVAEIGAFTGTLTRELLAWAPRRGARVIAIDPNAEGRLVELAEEHPELELLRERSNEALGRIPLPDALIFDGDHNYYAVTQDLRLIEERAGDGNVPMLIVHDAWWPHGRRDVYFEPAAIPQEHRNPIARNARVAPGNPGLSERGLGYEWIAQREGGPRNGVLTALEDFVEARAGLRLAVVPAFFGFGILWPRDAPWAGRIAEILAPYDRDPLIERLEFHRVINLVARIELVETLNRRERQLARLHALLGRMLGSRAFALAERLSGLRRRSGPPFSREEVRRALADDGQATT